MVIRKAKLEQTCCVSADTFYPYIAMTAVELMLLFVKVSNIMLKNESVIISSVIDYRVLIIFSCLRAQCRFFFNTARPPFF